MPQFRARPSRKNQRGQRPVTGTEWRNERGSHAETQGDGWRSTVTPRKRGGGFRFGPIAWQWRVLAVLVLTVTFLVIVVDTRVKPSIAAVAESIARRAASQAVNDALQNAVANAPDDAKILHVDTDASGNVRMATFDFHSVSEIEADATYRSEVTLSELARQTFPLPISQTIGGPLLSVFTPELPVRIHLVGSAHASVHMDVHTLGINQSVHALYLDIHAEVQAVAPLVTKPVDIQTSVPLAYVVLNGDIPHTYVGQQPETSVPVLPPISTQ